MRLEDLLNPVLEVDARPQLERLQGFLNSHNGPVLVPPELQNTLVRIIDQLKQLGKEPEALRTPTLANLPTRPVLETVIEHDIYINDKTKLSTLYRYPLHTYIEYPETGTKPVGHLFQLDPKNWVRPSLNFAYSLGKPAGQSRKSEEVFCPVLVDAEGELVPCVKRYSTCQGLKACPFNDIEELTSGLHMKATREDIELRLHDERESRLECSSPQRDIFHKTAAYIATLRNQGCTRRLSEVTIRSNQEKEEYEAHQERLVKFRRGYVKRETCEGRIVFKSGTKASLMCEHYSAQNKDHWADFTISNGSYDLNYIEAIFSDNSQAIHEIEDRARLADFGPLAQCSFVSNFSSQKLYCPTEHRDESGLLYQPQLVHLECLCRFRVFEPIESQRDQCPFLLVITQGGHSHPIPLPEKTPAGIRTDLFSLLESLGEDLPDMTPRAFLRHPTVQAFLTRRFPNIQNPTLSHLHSSLANRSHLHTYIEQAKMIHFPKGTDWKGVLYRKEIQDAEIEPKNHYIRTILDIPDETLTEHEEDEPAIASNNNRTRIIICMSPEASRRLLNAQYLQSDIGFKRIVGFMEFELASMERDANTSLIFCRIHLNRQTAAAHQRIFQEIERIVYLDTGRRLKWRHLEARSLDEYEGMILHWAADQHRGQAKGLGLHLQSLAQTLGNRMDLHEPERSLASLTPYDHLFRLLRICDVHVCRRIQSANVSEEVKKLMRSLICITHNDWDGTILRIKELGGKTGVDWVNDKLSSKFVFPGICWERSYIPLAIWKAGERSSNLIESVHRDVNREGVHCTLLGGIIKGQRFDALKMKTLHEFETTGIRPTYQPVNIVVNATKNHKRTDKKHFKVLAVADFKIETHNAKLQAAHGKVNAARVKLQELYDQRDAPGSDRAMLQTRISTTQRTEERARIVFNEQVEVGRSLIGTGSGTIGVLLPSEP